MGIFTIQPQEKKEIKKKQLNNTDQDVGKKNTITPPTSDEDNSIDSSNHKVPRSRSKKAIIVNEQQKSDGCDLDNLSITNEEKPEGEKKKKSRKKGSTASRKRVKRQAKDCTTTITIDAAATRTEEHAISPIDAAATTTEDNIITSSTHGNPFANKGETRLGNDMAVLAEALNLDMNTQTMLAYYDARSIEDFCLMAEADLSDLTTKARSMNCALPPLQIRKIQVLREWVQGLSDPVAYSKLPAWIQRKTPKPKKGQLVPTDWKKQLKKDLPRLKEDLKAKGDNMSSIPFVNYVYSFRSLVSCGV